MLRPPVGPWKRGGTEFYNLMHVNMYQVAVTLAFRGTMGTLTGAPAFFLEFADRLVLIMHLSNFSRHSVCFLILESQQHSPAPRDHD